jgi:Protein of unknown function (DUF3485)
MDGKSRATFSEATMKNQKWIIMAVVFALIVGAAGALTWLKKNQKLGKPGVKGTPIPGSVAIKIHLPAQVLDFTSTNVPEPAVAIGYFPKDTSYAERDYTAPDGLQIQNTIVMMGADRTSIHRPEYCLPGQGWHIANKKVVNLSIPDSPPYKMPVDKWVVGISLKNPDGGTVTKSGLYVFWYVADGALTPSHDKMLEWLTLHLLRTGTLQRWAYVSYFAVCDPGQEDATFERMKKLITASVPQFQYPPVKK